MLKALGPGVIFMALAQGSGELIWWPYIIAKYGLSFLFLLLPACLLQFPVTYEIGRYTVLTGESIFQGFIRLHRTFAFLLVDLDDPLLSLVWRVCRGRRHFVGGADRISRRVGRHAARRYFGATRPCWDFWSAILLSKVIYQMVESFHVGRGAAHRWSGCFGRAPMPRCLRRSGFANGLIFPDLSHAATVGSR